MSTALQFNDGNGLSLSFVKASDLSEVIYEQNGLWPPGFALAISPFIEMGFSPLKMAAKVNFRENRQLHATEILTIIKKNKFSYEEYPARVSYSHYSLDKGQKNIHFIKIFKDLILSRFIK